MFIIIELQTTNGHTANIVTTKDTKNEALSTYHTILASAAISQVDVHTAVVMDIYGNYIAMESFDHTTNTNEEG